MKFPRLSQKTWIAIGLIVLVGVLVYLGRAREGMENPPASELSARLNAIKAKIQPSGNPELARFEEVALPLFLLAFAKDSVPTTDPAVLAAFESKNFSALKGLKVNDASPDVLVAIGEGRSPQLSRLADTIIDGLAGPTTATTGPGGASQAFKDGVVAHVKRVFVVPPTSIEPLVRNGTLKNYVACVGHSTAQSVAKARGGDMNNALFETCKIYYKSPAWIDGQPPSVEDRKPEYGGPSGAPTPPVPSPSMPSSSANYSATCNKCTVLNNQITCACDVLPK